MPPFILTLRLDGDTFSFFDDLRQEHFPPERNVVPAHVTLFHKLPGEEEEAIRQTLQTHSAATPPFDVSFPALRFIGGGVAAEVESDALRRLRRSLAGAWAPWLSAQDQQGYRPHVTLQNKEKPAVARDLYERLNAAWSPIEGRATGLLLWRYLGGPWDAAGTFLFEANP